MVISHALFLRSDREYLRDMLSRHGDRVIVALNRSNGATKDTDLDNVGKRIETVVCWAFPNGRVQLRLAEFSVKPGSGIHEVTRLICEVVTARSGALLGDWLAHRQSPTLWGIRGIACGVSDVVQR